MKTYILTLLLLSLAGCGVKTPDEESLEMIRVNQDAKLDAFVESIQLDTKTPEGVGTLLSLREGDNRSIGLCTWFLVDEQFAVTNSHCVPEVLKLDSRNCKHLMQGAFKTRKGVEIRACKRLIKASSLSSSVLTNNDYALIELDKKVEAKTFALARTGVQDQEKIKILTMNHAGTGPIVSTFKTHECVVRSSDIYGRWISEGTSPMTAFKEELSDDHCKTISGNSGSPVLNWNGKVIGVLHGGIDESAKFAVQGPIGETTTNNLAVFTNFRCLTLGMDKFDQDLPKNCDEAMRDSDEIKKAMTQKLEAKFSAVLRAIVAMLPAFVDYKIDSQNFGTKTYVYFSPKCVRPLSTWSDMDKAAIRKKGFIFRTQEIDARIGQYEISTSISSDYYGNFLFDVIPKLRFTNWYEIKKLEDLDDELIPVILQPGEGVLEKREMKIGACPN